jgi:hypothetical protein
MNDSVFDEILTFSWGTQTFLKESDLDGELPTLFCWWYTDEMVWFPGSILWAIINYSIVLFLMDMWFPLPPMAFWKRRFIPTFNGVWNDERSDCLWWTCDLIECSDGAEGFLTGITVFIQFWDNELAVISSTTFSWNCSSSSIHHSSRSHWISPNSFFDEFICPGFHSDIHHHVQIAHQCHLFLPKNRMPSISDLSHRPYGDHLTDNCRTLHADLIPIRVLSLQVYDLSINIRRNGSFWRVYLNDQSKSFELRIRPTEKASHWAFRSGIGDPIGVRKPIWLFPCAMSICPTLQHPRLQSFDSEKIIDGVTFQITLNNQLFHVVYTVYIIFWKMSRILHEKDSWNQGFMRIWMLLKITTDSLKMFVNTTMKKL